MKEYKPIKKLKFSKLFYFKYVYVLIAVLVIFILGRSYSLTFFKQNMKIAEGSLATANVTIEFNGSSSSTSSSVSATGLDKTKPLEFSKSITVENTSNFNGSYILSLERTSGLNLTDMKYALIINGAIQEIGNVPSDGVILTSTIMAHEEHDIEVRLWPKDDYTGSETTFAGNLKIEKHVLSVTGSYYINSQTLTANNNYVYFNCNGNSCEKWRIVGTTDGRLVLTTTTYYGNTFTNSNLFNDTLVLNDYSLVTSMSTDNHAVYLKKTVEITSGNGTIDNPYVLKNNDYNPNDEKVIANITYTNGSNTTTQPIYRDKTNYISHYINQDGFQGWSTTDGGDVDYVLGDTVDFTSNTMLYAVIKTLYGIIQMANLSVTTNQPIMDNVASQFVTASTGINFGAVSSDTNGKGVYMRAGTENDAYPIMYYRGNVDNNNVLFNNKCWKAVRTTDTGGVKLIYNGSASANKAPLSESEYTIVTNTGNFAFDSSDNTWTRTITGSDGSSSSPLEISFKVPARENYIIQITGTTSTSGQASITIYRDTQAVNGTGNGGGGALNLSYTYGTLTADNVIKMTYYGNGTSESPTIIKVKMVYTNETMGYGCDNSGTDAQITLSGTNTFPFSGTNLSKSLAYNGYMWGEVYEWTNEATVSGAYYGTGFTWDGTNYTLTSAKVGYDGTHHYTCNSTTVEGTCSSIRYYYYVGGTSYNYWTIYITLTGGDSIENAIEKMQTNTNPSNAKTQIDTWYAANMSTVTSKLEDTIWCNDRSISLKAGWDPTGNVTGNYLYYSPYDRAYNTNVPSLSCANKNDAFTVSNGNGNQKLTYPVALLTSDEITLAGGKGGSSSTFYLASGAYYWSLSPNSVYNGGDDWFHVGDNGGLYYTPVDITSGLRPAVSLKHGAAVISGTGTVSDPYIVS